MNRPNIISAGKMMAIVVMLFGVLHCGATFTSYMQNRLTPLNPEMLKIVLFYSFISGAILAVCGLLLLVMFGKADKNPILGTPILIIGTFVAIYGILSVVFIYKNPFAWMTAILGLAIFIDTLCLKLNLNTTTSK